MFLNFSPGLLVVERDHWIAAGLESVDGRSVHHDDVHLPSLSQSMKPTPPLIDSIMYFFSADEMCDTERPADWLFNIFEIGQICGRRLPTQCKTHLQDDGCKKDFSHQKDGLRNVFKWLGIRTLDDSIDNKRSTFKYWRREGDSNPRYSF